MRADEFNARGYWEDNDIVSLNEDVLGALGRTWRDASPIPDSALGRLADAGLQQRAVALITERTSPERPFGIKDPRIAVLLPFWHRVFRDSRVQPSFVVVVRHPELVAASLARRDGMPSAWGHWLWISHMLAAIEGSEGTRRAVVPFEALLSNPAREVERMAVALGLKVDPVALDEYVRDFVDPLLVSAPSWRDAAAPARCPDLALRIHAALEVAAAGGGEDAISAALVAQWRLEAANAQGLLELMEHRTRQTAGPALVPPTGALPPQSAALACSPPLRSSEGRHAPLGDHGMRLDSAIPETRTENPASSTTTDAAPARRVPGGRTTAADAIDWALVAARRAARSVRVLVNAHRPQVMDPGWYLSRYPDARSSRLGARLHFALYGAFAGYAPNPILRPDVYWSHRPHVAARSMPAALHFALHGFRDPLSTWGRDPEESSATALPPEYGDWIDGEESRPRDPVPPNVPSVSVLVPVCGVAPDFLRRMLSSIQRQDHPKWEACIACADGRDSLNGRILSEAAASDARIRVRFLERNLGISGNSNEALRDARGDFVALLDHDDELPDGALLDLAAAAALEPSADFLYSDKDLIEGDPPVRQRPLFKPSWSPEMLLSVNYLTHLNLMRRSIVQEVGGFRPEMDGAQDWDLFLRVCERSRRIVRVPGVKYHWRIHAGSTSTGMRAKPYALDAQLRAVRSHVSRLSLPADVIPCPESGFRLEWRIDASVRVTILVDLAGLDVSQSARARSLIQNVARQLPHCGVEIGFIEEGGSHEDAARRVLASSGGTPEALVFVSGRIVSITDGALRQLVGWVVSHPHIGFASALVLRSDGSVGEAGHVVDRLGEGVPLFHGAALRETGWFGGALWRRNCSAAGPWAIAFGARAVACPEFLDCLRSWPRSLVRACGVVRSMGLRGVVEPSARVTVPVDAFPPVPTFRGSDDPYFHPAFESVSPLRLRVRAASGSVAFRRIPASSPVSEARAIAVQYACDSSCLAAPQQHPERIGLGRGAGWCNWHLPSIGNPHYGGTMTVFRLADSLRRLRDMRQRFIVDPPLDASSLRASISRVFPRLSDSEFVNAASLDVPESVPPADWSFATLWTTAYRLLRVSNTGLKFYLVQDYEPLFYPAGSTSAQVELTYRFGFHHVANTHALGALLARDHGSCSCAFDPQVDLGVFHGALHRPDARAKRVFFYGRPGHPRNGFELGIETLVRLKRRLGDRVEIVSAGADWDPQAFGLQGVMRNLGVLAYEATADLYRSCHACLAMMMTRHPSYLPLEFMACGGLVISNFNAHNSWLMRDGENSILLQPSAPVMADGLHAALDRYERVEDVRRSGQDLVRQRYGDWEGTLARLVTQLASLETAGAAPLSARLACDIGT